MEYSTPLVASVASVISRSRCLRGVTLRHVCVDCQGSVALAAALTANKSLVRLELKDCSFASVCPTQLYKAVHGDPTLRAAVLPGLYERFDTRITVPAFLCHVAGPGRLSLSLSAGDLVHAPLGCDLHLQLGHMDFSASEASGILAVIAGSHSLLHLGVELGHDRRKAELLLDAVRTNQSIKSFALLLTSWPRSDGVLADCVDSLVASTTLEEVALTMTALEVSSAESLARLVSNSRIKKLSVSVYSAVDDAVLEALARGMGESKFVVEFQFACGCWPPLSRSTHRLFDAVERNMGLLNRAAGFALGTATDVASATAFDALCDGPALFPHVERLSSQREHGAAQLLARAKCRIAGDFFVLAGVVRERIVCHPGPATQFDSLNSDCLAAIARWLKLDDVRRG
ncbi:uncharacterized protein LOC144149405 [Haemaphysalis longicornis]